jgi:hypothetical protein
VSYKTAAPPTPQKRWVALGNVSIADQTKPIAKPTPPLGQARRKHGAIVGRDRLTWRVEAGGFVLYYRHTRQVLAHVTPDQTWPRMFRVRTGDGRESDIANLPRTKEAALAAALRIINSEAQETAAEGQPARFDEWAATAAPPRTCASRGAR